MKQIHLWGVRQNNLKNIEVKIPIGSLTVICGPSGSGKSSLAFETLFAEGQRRFTESLSNYSKQFLNKAPKPDIDGVNNIPPAISIEQKNSVKTSRSTVGTATEIIDYLRLLYEKTGKAYCPDHHIQLERDSLIDGSHKIIGSFSGTRGYILAPVPENDRLLNGKKLLEQLEKDGILRIYIPKAKDKVSTKKTSKKVSTKSKRVKTSTKKVVQKLLSDGENSRADEFSFHFEDTLGDVVELTDPKIKRYGVPKTDFYVVVDRLGFNSDELGRIKDSLSQAYTLSLKYNDFIHSGQALVVSTEGRHLFVSEDLSCSKCSFTFPSLSSRMFSFNSPVGACEKCNGFGNVLELDEAKVVPDPTKSITTGALSPFSMPSATKDRRVLLNFCRKSSIDIHTPWKDLPQKHRDLIWKGNKDFFGVEGLFEYLETKKYKMHVRVFLSRFKSPSICSACHGTRLRPETQQVLISGFSITDMSSLSVIELLEKVNEIKLSPSELEVCKELILQLKNRLTYLKQVGVGYLTIDRPTRTLSGGEFQRLILANQLGMGLSQTLYVLDEPTVGLHPRDNDRLIEVLKGLNNLGNTLVIVEHDHDVIKSATHVLEMGPGSGYLGGEVLFSGTIEEFLNDTNSNTARFINGSSLHIPYLTDRSVEQSKLKYKVELKNCSGHNLKNIDLTIPLNRIVTVTGVSGSGKSSLITQTLYPALARELGVEFIKSLPFESIVGFEKIKGLLLIDQSPIGKTARSNPVTYLKVFDAIRSIFATLPESKSLGYTPGTFSLNVDGGRCPVCKGLGHEIVDMMFMDDLQIECDSCNGKKFRNEILEIKYRGKSIHDILKMTVLEAMDFFVAHPNIRKPLSVLREVGLEYLTLGQSASSLSGGESQRLKIAREFNQSQHKSTLYILDEPTTGLHFREVQLLIKVLNRLVDAGGSVLLVEHNLEIIRNSDWVIDIGPEAGPGGGKIVFEGSPNDLVNETRSQTGLYLNQYMQDLSLIPKKTFSSKKKPLRSKGKGAGL